MAQPYAVAGVEPPLQELLNDEIAHLVMRRDGLEPADVWRSVEEARSRLVRTATVEQLGGEAAADDRVGLGERSSIPRAVGT